MAGLTKDTPIPTDIKLHQASKLLEVIFDNYQRFMFTHEFLRVHSPSAEVRGHGDGQAVLQTGKKDVQIVAIEPVGNYAILLKFSDKHDTGIFSWDYLWDLATHQSDLWESYLKRLEAVGGSRER